VRRWVPLLLLVVALFVVSAPLTSSPAAAQAPAADPAGLDIVRAAYDDLLSLFYRPLDPVDLLTAGWSSLASDLARAGDPPPPALGSLADDRDAAFSGFAAAYAHLLASAPPGVTPTGIAYAIADGMTRSVRDDHTNFLPPQAYQGLETSLGGGARPVGAGIRFAPDNPRLVAQVAPDGPADRAGVRPGDLIDVVSGGDPSLGPGQAVSQSLAAPAGTVLSLTLDRAGQALDLMLTTGPYYFPALESRLLPDGAGYIRLDRFVSSGLVQPDGKEILSDLDNSLDSLDAQGAQGLILDLRNNGGGDTFTAQELLGRFLPQSVLAILNYDERGDRAFDPVSGLMRRQQLPLVVLVNARSASASEVTASTLRDAGRALVVGEPTAGDLASADLLPLAEGAGMELAVAEVASGQTGAPIDHVGVGVDVAVPDSRTAADYAAGRDPQLDAAAAALAQAPAPPAYDSTPTDLSSAELSAMLGGLLPAAGEIPTNDRLTPIVPTNYLVLTHPNEWIDINGGAGDPLALAAAVRARGYQGSLVQAYGPGPEQQPAVQVAVDAYATPQGAAAALESNDFPEVQTTVPSPVQLGDETAAYRGAWIGLGTDSISWRHGGLVFTVAYSDVPDESRPDTLVALAQLVNSIYQQAMGSVAR
jgi:carboxyl-terminal processing protease